MSGQRSMTGLAVHVRMHPRRLRSHDVRVAVRAGLMAGKMQRAGSYLANGRRAIVPIFTKGLGNYKAAHHQKDQKNDDEEPRKPEQMFYILKPIH
jgi:hypothetical protein